MAEYDNVTYPRQVLPPEHSIATIGGRIRQARKDLDLNQDALAARLGVTQPTVANWEADVHNPRQLMLAKLAETLRVSLAWLASGTETERAAVPMARSGYVARALYHVPVLPAHELTPEMDVGEANLHARAVDYIPISARSGRHLAVFLDPGMHATTFPGETLFVFDVLRQDRVDGGYGLVVGPDNSPRLVQWPSNVDDAEACLGTLAITVRFF